MALYEVVVRQTFSGQECINRYNYISSGTPAAVTRSFGLASAMGYVVGAGITDFPAGTLAAAVQSLQVIGTSYIDILVKNIYDPEDFYVTNFNPGTNGTAATASESMAPFLAFGFRAARSRLDIRSGYKRYVGLAEEQVTNGGEIVIPLLTGDLATAATRLGDTITYDDEGNTLTYEPVIVKKFPYTTPSGNTAYRYATDADGGEAAQLAQVASAANWTPYPEVRSQVSRQYGRGR